jgi:ribosomal protein S18 acetylase RimI-like enzyme
MRLAELRPGWRSDFILHRQGALVAERGDCIAVRTPGNPTFYWGNFLLLPTAPLDADLAFWQRRFHDEIGRWQPESLHLAFGVNGPPDGQDLPAWRAQGFDLVETAVLRLHAGQLRAPAKPPRGDLRFRAFDLKHEIEAIVALQCADSHGFEAAGYAGYRRRQMARYAQMAGAGLAAWFGVWCDGVLAADCGLMRDGPLGRFQRVATHPAWRRRGLCSALVHGVSSWGLEHWGLEELLMCADPEDVAIGIYESLGFCRIDRECCLQRYAPQDEGARRPAAAA